MDFEAIVTTVRDWLSHNWTDLGVLLLTVCNFSSFVVKKIYSWRLKKNDSTKTCSLSSQGQADISQNGEEHEGNQCDAESNEGRNQIMSLKVSGLSSAHCDDSVQKDSSSSSSSVLHQVELLYKVKQIVAKFDMSNDSKIEVLKYILEVEDEN